MKPMHQRAVPHSLSCTAIDWERIRDLAERADKPISRYIVDRVLRDDGPDGAEAEQDDGLVLDGKEQRAMHDAALRAETLVSQLVCASGEDSSELGEAVRTLFEARLDEMARARNHEVMKRLLTRTVGPERATGIIERVMERTGRGR